MKIVIATHNKSKFERYHRLLNNIKGLELVSLSDLTITEKVAEPFASAKENALYKAKEYAKLTNLPTLAIDEATDTNFLPKHEQPGVYVRRYADKNHEMTDGEQLIFWRKIFAENPHPNKQFIWDFQIALYSPQTGKVHTSEAEMVSHVTTAFSETIQPGYPMSSFLIVDGTSKPYVDLTDEEKLEADKKVFQTFLTEFPSWITG